MSTLNREIFYSTELQSAIDNLNSLLEEILQEGLTAEILVEENSRADSEAFYFNQLAIFHSNGVK